MKIKYSVFFQLSYDDEEVNVHDNTQFYSGDIEGCEEEEILTTNQMVYKEEPDPTLAPALAPDPTLTLALAPDLTLAPALANETEPDTTHTSFSDPMLAPLVTISTEPNIIPESTYFRIEEITPLPTLESIVNIWVPPTTPPTEPPTEPPTDPITDLPTELPTKPPADTPTDPPAETYTYAPTQPPRELITQPATKAPTEPPTELPTEPPTTTEETLHFYETKKDVVLLPQLVFPLTTPSSTEASTTTMDSFSSEIETDGYWLHDPTAATSTVEPESAEDYVTETRMDSPYTTMCTGKKQFFFYLAQSFQSKPDYRKSEDR